MSQVMEAVMAYSSPFQERLESMCHSRRVKWSTYRSQSNACSTASLNSRSFIAVLLSRSIHPSSCKRYSEHNCLL